MTNSVDNIAQWVETSAVEFPERVAIEDAAGGSIQYRELARVSRAVQARLASIGIRAGDRVGILARKSIDALIAFQAILRAGAAYVPADPFAPTSRAAFVLTHSETSAVFVDEDLADSLRRELEALGHRIPLLVLPAKPAENHTWRIETLTAGPAQERVAARYRDLALLLYTSGSTGKPKGVMLTHENVVDFIDWGSEAFALTSQDKLAVHSPLHFSLPVFNVYVAWKRGATVVLIGEQTAKTPKLLAPLLERCGITVWFSTPTILSLLAQSGELPSLNLNSLRLIMFGGEAFPAPYLRNLRAQLPDSRYCQILGSTETHMMSHYDVPKDLADDLAEPIPIGRVCTRFRNQILGEDGKGVSAGSDGELCLSGPGVTPGYWKMPEETARAFFTDAKGDRWYRTGDIVRLRQDGNLLYRGRRDRMVKKRGNRIELAEIESCLYGNTAVKEVGVVAIPDEELGLKIKAFVVRQGEMRSTIIDLKRHCALSLPQYMVPDVFTFIDALPRTSTGKIDFPKLKEMD